MNNKMSKSKSIALGLATILLVGSGAAAFAFWSGAGTGTGTAPVGAGTVGGIVVMQNSVLTSFNPGSAPQHLKITLNNPTAVATSVANVAVTVDSVKDSGGALIVGCSAADFMITNSFAVGASFAPSSTGTTVYDSGSDLLPVTLEMINATTNQDKCKGATVGLKYVAS